MLATNSERLPGSSEVLESIIEKYKRLQGEHGHYPKCVDHGYNKDVGPMEENLSLSRE